MTTTTAYGCDYWLPSRAKCWQPAPVRMLDEHGAPLRFCRQHARLADDLRAQYGPVQLDADWLYPAGDRPDCSRGDGRPVYMGGLCDDCYAGEVLA